MRLSLRNKALCCGLALVATPSTAPAVGASTKLTEVPNGVVGYTTYELSVQLTGNASNVYAMYGTPESPMSFPPVYGLKPRALAGGPGLHSWLTIGRDTPESALTSAGIDWSAWTNSSGFTSTNALIFIVPDAGPSADGQVLLGTLSVESDSQGVVTLGLQGRSVGGAASTDWTLDGVAFTYDGADSTSARATPPAPPPVPSAPAPACPKVGCSSAATRPELKHCAVAVAVAVMTRAML